MNAPLSGQGWSPGRVPAGVYVLGQEYSSIQWVSFLCDEGRRERTQEIGNCSAASSAKVGISIIAAVSVHNSAQRTLRPG